MRVKDKSIIVTGAGGGIGEGIAKRLAAEGAQVIVNDINAALGEQVVEAILRDGGHASFFAADVTKSADDEGAGRRRRAAPRQARRRWSTTPAGRTATGPALEVSEDEFDRCYLGQREEHLPLDHPRGAGLPRQRRRQSSSTSPRPPACARARASPGTTARRARSSRPASRWPPNSGPTTSASTASTRCSTRTPAWRPSSQAARSPRSARPSSAPPSRWAASRPRSTWPTRRSTWPATKPSFISGVCIEVDGARCV